MRHTILFILILFSTSSFMPSRHLIEVDVIPNGKVLVEHEFVKTENVCDTILKRMFYYDYRHPAIHRDEREMPKVLVSIYSYPSVRYGHYLAVYDEIEKAYINAWNILSFKHYSKEFEKLSASQRKKIKEILPRKVSEAEPM